MFNYLKLMRWPNLLMVAITMYAIRLGLIYPMLRVNELHLQLPEWMFGLLVLATVLITGAGYVINDYFDLRTDAVNRPDTVLVGQKVKRRMAMALHWWMNTVAVLIGFFLSWRVGYWQFGFLFVITTGLLWYYSTDYKRRFLIGNIVVSLLTALVPLLVLMFEVPLLNSQYGEWLRAQGSNLNYITKWVLAYAYFAFLTNMIRELVKDIEDFEGDRAFGRNTLPVVLGVERTKYVLLFLVLTELVSMFGLYFWVIKDWYSLAYFLLVLALPFGYLLWMLYKAKSRSDYSRASALVKLIMLGGLGYLAVVSYNLSLL